jgi:hypothetical protein
MTKSRMTTLEEAPRDLRAYGFVVVCALLLGGLVAAHAQQPAPPEPPAVDVPGAPEQASRPGLLDTLGRWLGDSKAKVDEQLKSTQDVLEGLGKEATSIARDAAGAAQQATGAVVTLPISRIVDGRERCAPAPNGAPNCPPAVVAMCRAKGFTSGRSVDIRTSEKCPARVRLSGRAPETGECTTETFVLRAVCQ